MEQHLATALSKLPPQANKAEFVKAWKLYQADLAAIRASLASRKAPPLEGQLWRWGGRH